MVDEGNNINREIVEENINIINNALTKNNIKNDVGKETKEDYTEKKEIKRDSKVESERNEKKKIEDKSKYKEKPNIMVKSKGEKMKSENKRVDMKKHIEHKSEHKTKKKKCCKTWYYVIGAVVVVAIAIVLILLFTKGETQKSQYKDSDVVAIVNGEKITYGEMMQDYNNMPPQYQMMMTLEMSLNNTIMERLFMQDIKKHNIEVTDDEVKKALNDWVSAIKAQIGEEQYKAALSQQGFTEESFLDSNFQVFKKQLLVAKLLNQTGVLPREISDEEAKEYYNNNTQMFKIDEMVNAAHILIGIANRTDEEAKALAESILERVNKGEDFATLAKEYSEDPGSSSTGGNYTFQRKTMVPEFEEFAFSNEVGKTGIVKTSYGYHVMKILEKFPARVITFDEVKDKIKQVLLSQKQSLAISQYAQKLWNESSITILYVNPNSTTGIKTFRKMGDEICRDANGKPIIRLYTTSTCPHCKWIRETFDKVAKEYVSKGQITAYHWELDTKDDLLTITKESEVPQEDLDLFTKYNSQYAVPAFVFGCQYVRIGNGYEQNNDLASEEAEFRAVINQLLS